MTEFDLAAVDHLLTTTRSVRRRLDLDRDVPRSVVTECLRLAIHAPTGRNLQAWRWLVVTDAAVRAAIAELYRRSQASVRSTRPPSSDPTDVSVRFLRDNLARVPVLVVPCIDESAGQAAGWAPSIYPAVWSFQLALRSRGLGSCITTSHLRFRREAAEILGIPAGTAQACLLPVAYYTGTTFQPRAPPAGGGGHVLGPLGSSGAGVGLSGRSGVRLSGPRRFRAPPTTRTMCR